MFDVSLGKLVLVGLIALIVLGPEKLPGAARTTGALLRRLRSGWDSVRAEVAREVELEDIRRAARDATAQVQAARAGMDDVVRSVRTPVDAVTASLMQPATGGGGEPAANHRPSDGEPAPATAAVAHAVAPEEEGSA